MLLAANPRELAEQLLLLRVESRRCLDIDVHVQVAATDTTGQMRDTTCAQCHNSPRLGAGLDVDRLFAVERLELHGRAKCSRGHGQRKVAVQVVAVAGEHRIRPLVDFDVEVAGGSATGPDLALTAVPDAQTVGDAGRDLHGQRPPGAHPSLARTVRAWVADARAHATALGARARCHELAEERALHAL